MDEAGPMSAEFVSTCGEAERKDAKKSHGRLNLITPFKELSCSMES